MASKMVETVVRSLHMPVGSKEDLVRQVVETVTDAATQEGVILSRKNTVAVPRALPRQHGIEEETFEQQLRQALHQATGVQLQVMLYSEEVGPEHPLCSLCALTAGKNAQNSIVLVQGETPPAGV